MLIELSFLMGILRRRRLRAVAYIVDLRTLVCSCNCGTGDEYAAHDP